MLLLLLLSRTILWVLSDTSLYLYPYSLPCAVCTGARQEARRLTARCTRVQFDLDFWNAGGRFPDTFPQEGQAYLSEIVLNTETGEATRHRVTRECGEFPSTAQHVSGGPWPVVGALCWLLLA